MLSVVVPVYNTERYLTECVRSLQAQTFKDMEILLIDDGSTDGSPALCDSFAAADPRIRVFHKANEGLGFTRNYGLERARGEYVTFFDSDDVMHPDAYAECIRQMEREQADMVRFDYARFFDSGEHAPEHYTGAPVIFSTPEDMRMLALCIFDVPSGASKRYDIGGSSCMAVYRRELLVSRGLRFVSEREYISEDYVFNLEFYRLARRVVWLPRTYYHYRINASSLTRRLDLDVMARVEFFCRHIEGLLARYGFTPEECLVARGYYLHALRFKMRAVFMSQGMSMSEKKRWFKERTSDPYFRDTCRVFPPSRLSVKQGILYRAFRSRNFPLAWLMIVGFSLIRIDKVK